MSKKKKKSSPQSGKSTFHEGLEGFDIKINPFGELESTFEIDRLNTFLNQQIADKKLKPSKESSEEE